MTLQEAKAFIEAFVKLREFATDDMALQVPNLYPIWKSGVSYTTGQRVLHDEVLYKVLQDHTSQEAWTPVDAPSLFAQVLIPDENVIPEWIQPDSTNPYMTGDKVVFNGKVYESTLDYNTWSPETYPQSWKEIQE